MTITLSAGMSTQADADAFNQLSIYCIERTLHFEATINGKYVSIKISGDKDIMLPLISYLEDKQYGF